MAMAPPTPEQQRKFLESVQTVAEDFVENNTAFALPDVVGIDKMKTKVVHTFTATGPSLGELCSLDSKKASFAMNLGSFCNTMTKAMKKDLSAKIGADVNVNGDELHFVSMKATVTSTLPAAFGVKLQTRMKTKNGRFWMRDCVPATVDVEGTSCFMGDTDPATYMHAGGKVEESVGDVVPTAHATPGLTSKTNTFHFITDPTCDKTTYTIVAEHNPMEDPAFTKFACADIAKGTYGKHAGGPIVSTGSKANGKDVFSVDLSENPLHHAIANAFHTALDNNETAAQRYMLKSEVDHKLMFTDIGDHAIQKTFMTLASKHAHDTLGTMSKDGSSPLVLKFESAQGNMQKSLAFASGWSDEDREMASTFTVTIEAEAIPAGSALSKTLAHFA